MKKQLASTEGGAIDLGLSRQAVKHAFAIRAGGAGSGLAAATVRAGICATGVISTRSRKRQAGSYRQHAPLFSHRSGIARALRGSNYDMGIGLNRLVANRGAFSTEAYR
jgi:hypothetical protein